MIHCRLTVNFKTGICCTHSVCFCLVLSCGRNFFFSQIHACKILNEIISLSSFISPKFHRLSSQKSFVGADFYRESQRWSVSRKGRYKLGKKSIAKLLHNFTVLRKYFLKFITVIMYIL